MLSSFVGAPVAMLSVGDPHQVIHVHRNVLTGSSLFFREIDSPSSSSKNTRHDLPDINATSLGIYVDWLYSGEVKTKHDDIVACAFGRSAIIEDDEYCALATLYRLGRKLEDEHFANAVMNACREKLADAPCAGISTLPGCHAIEIIYDDNPQYVDDMAKKAVHDAFVRAGKIGHFDAMEEDVPAQFLRDLCRSLLASRKWVGLGAGGGDSGEQCEYHVHSGGLNCDEEQARKRRRRRTDE